MVDEDAEVVGKLLVAACTEGADGVADGGLAFAQVSKAGLCDGPGLLNICL